MAKKLTEEEALKVLQELENEYSFRFEGGYKNAITKNLHVTCNKGHQYFVTYNNFTSKKARCPHCASEKMSIEKRFNEGEALETLQDLEPSYKFRFEGGYKSAKTKNLHVTCDKGHEYISTYSHFVNHKNRCPHCVGVAKLTEQEALKILQELEPGYTFRFEDGYKGAHEKNLHITCNHNHQYISTYNNFKQGYRCPHCAGVAKPTEDEALKILYELESEYTFKFIDGYKNAMAKNLHVTCNKGHEYFVTYSSFVNGKARCPHCVNHKSKPETEIIAYIKTFYNKDIEQSNRTLIKNRYTNRHLELDIYLPDIKLAIEFNGIYWHSDKVIKENKIGFNTSQEYHEYKYNACKQLGITLLHIDEQEYIDNKSSILQNIKNKIQLYINLNKNKI